MLIKNISLINNSASIDFSAATINLPNISTSKCTFSNFPISGGTLNSTTLNLGNANRTVLSGSNISNLASLSPSCGNLKINNTTVNYQNGINITSLNSISDFSITGNVSALTTNHIVLTSCSPLQSELLSGFINTKTLTFNAQKMQLRNSASISTSNNYTLSFGIPGDQNYRLVYIKVYFKLQLSDYILWDLYMINSPEESTFKASFGIHSFTMTITGDNKIIYKHIGNPPSDLKLSIYTSPFQINL